MAGRFLGKSSTDVSIISCAHDVADARLHRICAGLRRAGLGVEVIGLGDLAGAPADTVTFSLGQSRGKLTRLRNAATLPFRAQGRVVMTVDPDLVPVASLWRHLGRGRRLVVDVHEDYLALLHDRAWAHAALRAAARSLIRVATALTRRADLTVVADGHVSPAHARRRLVVRNLPDLTYLPEPSEPEPTPRAVYIGDVRRSRGLQAMVEAVAAAPPWQLDIVGPMSPDDTDWWEQWRASSPDIDRIRVHGRLAPNQAWKFAAGAWVGLVLLQDTPAFRKAVPTKLYEYLGSGLPVMVTPLPRMAEIVTAAHAGAVVQDPEQASAVLRAWYQRPEELHRYQQAARQWGEQNVAQRSPYDELADQVRKLVNDH